MIQHTVTFRFAEDAQVDAFWTRVDELREIPGVQRFAVLRQVGSKNDFTHGLSMYFESDVEYAAYNDHPVHVAFVAEAWLPNVADFLELDYVVDDR
ncbi:Dabb family protein [Ilumatobacter sp.]|uniref:Dabb family protein n=1 Tax=Ilumatobacter sp. TaxID=1967498 RepID=UPI003C5BEF1A